MSKFIEPNMSEVLTTEVPEGVTLFSIEDINKLKAEIASKEDYKLLKDDTYRLWVKTSGEGSGVYDANAQYDSIEAAKSPFLRHKYTCELPFSVQVFYDLSRDYKRRHEWDRRDAGRRIVKIIHVPNEPNGMKYQVPMNISITIIHQSRPTRNPNQRTRRQQQRQQKSNIVTQHSLNVLLLLELCFIYVATVLRTS